MKNNHRDSISGKISPVEIQKVLKGTKYPATKLDLMRCAKENNAELEILDILEKITDTEYRSPTEVTKEVGKID